MLLVQQQPWRRTTTAGRVPPSRGNLRKTFAPLTAVPLCQLLSTNAVGIPSEFLPLDPVSCLVPTQYRQNEPRQQRQSGQLVTSLLPRDIEADGHLQRQCDARCAVVERGNQTVQRREDEPLLWWRGREARSGQALLQKARGGQYSFWEPHTRSPSPVVGRGAM